MSRTFALAAALFFVATPAAAQPKDVPSAPAAPRTMSPVSFGTRVGLSIPSGQIDSGTRSSELFGVAMTQDLMVDIRLGDRFVFAPYGGYMKGGTGSAISCKGEKSDDCGMFGLQVGAMLRGTIARTNTVDFWAGYAFSHDWQTVLTKGAHADFQGNTHHAAFGVDFFINDRNDTRLGAYLDFAFGRFDEGKVTTWAGNGTVTDHGVHQWTTFGMQAVF